jgi:hypothetical protein
VSWPHSLALALLPSRSHLNQVSGEATHRLPHVKLAHRQITLAALAGCDIDPYRVERIGTELEDVVVDASMPTSVPKILDQIRRSIASTLASMSCSAIVPCAAALALALRWCNFEGREIRAHRRRRARGVELTVRHQSEIRDNRHGR